MVTPGFQDETLGPTVLRTNKCGRVPFHIFASLAQPQKVSKILSGTVTPSLGEWGSGALAPAQPILQNSLVTESNHL